MTTAQINSEISERILELKSLSLVLEGLFLEIHTVKINGEIFDGVSMFSMQRRACEDLSTLHDKLAHNLERGIL